MRSRISISDIRLKKNGEHNPLIVEFQNGDIVLDNLNKFRARLFNHDEHETKAVKVLSKNKQKYVNQIILSSPINRFVAIKNKKSNKVKLIEVNFTSLINQLHTRGTERYKKEISEKVKNDTLSRKFGTKKAMRILKEREIHKTDKSLVEEQISEILTDSKMNETSSITVNEEDNTIILIPPCNRNAKIVEEIYNINDCLSHEELLILENIASEILQNKYDLAESTDFFKTCLEEILKTNGNHKKKICCLLYASALITYIKTPAKTLRKIASSLCPYSKLISNKIVGDFSVKTGCVINKPTVMKDKAVCYVIVLLAIAGDFKIDLAIVAKQSGYGFTKMKQLGRLVGLVPTSKNSSSYVLKLPLPPPLKMVKSFQKKK